jgi:GNAT superfamily N-acetyltransferase
MKLQLAALPATEYAKLVLPLTEPLWGQGRSLDAYVEQTLELAKTTYGRRSYGTFALTDGSSKLLASFKRYERAARVGNEQLRAVGIGAVFTPEEHRGQGYASAMIGLALDEARANGFDFAYLFSDIHPQFYKELGFVELPSRSISVRADSLQAGRVAATPMSKSDWTGVRKCFDACDGQRPFGLTRSPAVWEWIRTRMQHRTHHPHGQPVELVVRHGKTVAAYVIGMREPKHDAYVVDEFAFADMQARALIAPLLRSAAGDLRRIVAWLPPAPARALLPRGSVRRRSGAFWMMTALTKGGSHFLEAARAQSSADGIWSLDHI